MRECLTCKINIDHLPGQAKFCRRLCHRRFPANKVKYRDRVNVYQRAHARDIHVRYGKLRAKCSHFKREFRLTYDEYENLVSQPCHYCTCSLDGQTGIALDRKDSNKGYTIENVLPCCGPCNQIKNVHLTVDEMKIAMDTILKFRMSSNS